MSSAPTRTGTRFPWSLHPFGAYWNEKDESRPEEEEKKRRMHESTTATTSTPSRPHFSGPKDHVRAADLFQSQRHSPDDKDNKTSDDGGVPCRRALLHGKEVCFELRENVTQRPPIEHGTKNNKSSLTLINAERSNWEIRMRLWMIGFSLTQVTVAYLALFVVLNLVFAGLFLANPDGCCDDPDLTLAQTFDFAVQTSSTIGYGGYVPLGMYPNFLVVMLNYTSIVLNTVLAGLLFLKFTTPVAKVQFSKVLVYCNVNGLPCLQLRVANCDGDANKLTNATAHLTYYFGIQTTGDEFSAQQVFVGNQELSLFPSQRDSLTGVWTLLHVVDEKSPLFGINLSELPVNHRFHVTIDAVHDITKSDISVHAQYMVPDILVGHVFENQMVLDAAAGDLTIDNACLDTTQPAPVWYPKPILSEK